MKSAQDESIISTADLVRIEKNLASIGFFTPSTKRIRGEKKKVVTRARQDDGKRVEGSATILPSAEYGLPITADQDTYFAILKLTGDILLIQGREPGRVYNSRTPQDSREERDVRLSLQGTSRTTAADQNRNHSFRRRGLFRGPKKLGTRCFQRVRSSGSFWQPDGGRIYSRPALHLVFGVAVGEYQ